MSNDFIAVSMGPLKLQDVKERMEALRVVQRFIDQTAPKGSREYEAGQKVIMLAIERIADLSAALGFDDALELEKMLFTCGLSSFEFSGT